MNLPKETSVSANPKEPPKTYTLPSTFSERASPAYVDYKIIVTVKRGFLKVNQTCVSLMLSLDFECSLA